MHVMKKYLEEVSVLRVLLVFLLVLDHTLAPYSGYWNEVVPNQVSSPIYYLIGKFAFSFMLELFVFISGYIFAEQVANKGIPKIGTLIKKKARRLMLPCIVFSLLYAFCFYSGYFYRMQFEGVMGILSGTAHLWFLSMLFLCFIELTILLRCQALSRKYLTFVLLCIMAYVYLPWWWLNFNKSLYYLLFFYVGFCCKYYISSLARYYTKVNSLICVFIYMVCMLSYSLLGKSGGVVYLEMPSNIYEMGLYVLTMTIRIGYSLFGCWAAYIIVYRMVYLRNFHLYPFGQKLASYSFGIYIFHHFIIPYIYYHSKLPYWINPYMLPIVTFIITSVASYAMTALLLKTKVGRALIG
jgi:fucose 4-O-acetylase-like acetyltransferase